MGQVFAGSSGDDQRSTTDMSYIEIVRPWERARREGGFGYGPEDRSDNLYS